MRSHSTPADETFIETAINDLLQLYYPGLSESERHIQIRDIIREGPFRPSGSVHDWQIENLPKIVSMIEKSPGIPKPKAPYVGVGWSAIAGNCSSHDPRVIEIVIDLRGLDAVQWVPWVHMSLLNCDVKEEWTIRFLPLDPNQKDTFRTSGKSDLETMIRAVKEKPPEPTIIWPNDR
jgi:hypothetical protein